MDVLDALRSLRTFVQNDLRPALHIPQDAIHGAIAVAHFSRATSTFDAIVMLGEHGLGSQAMTLNRALFELMVNAWWSRLDIENAETRYIEFARLDGQIRLDKARKYPHLQLPVDGPGLSAQELSALRTRFGAYGNRGWTGLSVRQRITALEAAAIGPGRADLMGLYEVVNYLSNQELHASSWSLIRLVRRVPGNGGDERLEYYLGAETDLVDLALPYAWWMYSRVLDLIITEFNVDSVTEPFETVQQTIASTFHSGGA
jgi:hypothetical protein